MSLRQGIDPCVKTYNIYTYNNRFKKEPKFELIGLDLHYQLEEGVAQQTSDICTHHTTIVSSKIINQFTFALSHTVCLWSPSLIASVPTDRRNILISIQTIVWYVPFPLQVWPLPFHVISYDWHVHATLKWEWFNLVGWCLSRVIIGRL